MPLKTLGAGDWARYRDIRLRALADTPNAFARTLSEEQAFSEEKWRSRLSGDGVVVVAEAGGQDAGLVGGVPLQDRADAACLVSMWVAPDHRRSGTGKALVQVVVAWAREAGFQTLVLDVADENTGTAAFYERLGFHRTGRTGTLPPPRTHITEHERALTP